MDCKWYLQGPVGHFMTFTFLNFNIVPGSNNCTGGDFLQIYDGRNESGKCLQSGAGLFITGPAEQMLNFG